MSASSPSSWQASILDLTLLVSSNGEDIKTTGNIEKVCYAILERDDAGDIKAAPLPETVRATVTTIYLRSLIKLGKYNSVVDYCQCHKKTTQLSESESKTLAKEGNSKSSNAEEVAYCLYRLKKYEACSRLCSTVSTTERYSRGMMHIHAQALYRMGETIRADAVYRRLLSTATTLGEDNGVSLTKSASDSDETNVIDADEREDTLSNALANYIANYTSGSNLVLSLSNKKTWLENDDTLRHLLSMYGAAAPTATSPTSTIMDDLLQNYDLAYNLGTYLLVSSEARSQSQLLQAKRLLEHAEISALTILDSSSVSPTTDSEEECKDNSEREGGMSATDKARLQQQQHQLAEREANPIRANLALSKLLLGGPTNEMDALRTYLTLITKAFGNKSNGVKKGAVAADGNLLATASNNLAVLRDGKESVFDVLKRIPMTSSLSVSEDGLGNSGKEKASGTMVPLVGATPQQVRTALYNRALLLAKMGNVAGCLEALNVLRASLLISYHGDESENSKFNENEMGSSHKRTKGKKQKGSTLVATASSGEIEKKDIPTAKPASSDEASAWFALTKLVETELYRKSESKDVSPHDIVDDAIAQLETISSNNDNENVKISKSGVLLYTMSQLMLYRAIVTDPSQQSKSLIDVLESLPTTMMSCPGVAISLASLYASSIDSQKNDIIERILSSMGDDTLAKIATAEFHFARRQHDDAARLLQVIVDKFKGDNSDDGSLSLEAMALLVKTLSYTDIEKAEMYSVSLQEAIRAREEGHMSGGPELNGEVLESMDIPRFAKKSADDHRVGSSSKVRKMIEATAGKGRSTLG